jgi:pSer/pThr/pTyr-binding forkhead associated (FHA) protein
MDLLHTHEGRHTQRPLPDGEHRLGEADGIPDALGLTLYVEGSRLSVEASTPVRVGGILLPARLRRLVVPGEAIEPVPGRVFRIRPDAPAAAPETRAVVRTLLDPGAMPAAASLIALTGPDAGRVIALTDRPLVVGRGEGVDVRLRDRAISRRHARITCVEDGHSVEDLGTANGVYVNGARLGSRYLLEDGALIELGQTLLRYCAGQPSDEVLPEPSEASSGPEETGAEGEASAEGGDAAAAGPSAADGRATGEDGVSEAGAGAGTGVDEGAPSASAGSAGSAQSATGSPGDGTGDSPGDGIGAQAATGDREHPVVPDTDARATRSKALLAAGALLLTLGLALTFGCLKLAKTGASGQVPPSTAAASPTHP